MLCHILSQLRACVAILASVTRGSAGSSNIKRLSAGTAQLPFDCNLSDCLSSGTAVTLYGFFPVLSPEFPATISYSVSLDGVPTTNYASSFTTDPDSVDNVLATFTNLTNDEHFVLLTVHNSAAMTDDSILLRFDRAVITSELPSTSSKQ